MGTTRLLQMITLLLAYPNVCKADCHTFFSHETPTLEINDSVTYEKGAVVRDYSNEVGNETLKFTNNGCDHILEVNGSRLILKTNLFAPSACQVTDFSCGWRCETDPLDQTLHVIIKKHSKGVLRFQKPIYNINISESTAVDTKLITFSNKNLTRDDCISLQNVFFLDVNEANFESRLDSNVYGIYLISMLDYDQPQKQFSLTITAKDPQNDELQSNATLVIQVTDVDDMDPAFDQNVYYLNITEGNTPNANITMTTTPPINATDRDEGEGRQDVYYSIEDDRYSECFTIDRISGKISVKCSLDRENITEYRLIVKAVQRNTDSRSCTATLSITVLDINDNIPVFDPTEYQANILEHSGVGTTVVRLLASDLDENPVTSFEILTPYNDVFTAKENGDILVHNPSKIDRESGNGTVVFQVKAKDNESGIYSTSTATVSVTLLDVNDKAPIFLKQEYVFPLPADPTEGYELGQVKALDDDQANTPNSEVRYRLQHTMSSNMFSIHNITGKLSLQKKPPSSTGVIELVVLAEDLGEPPLQSSAQILLSRTVVNGHSVNFTVPLSRDEAEKRKETILKDIGHILNLKVSLDKIDEVLNHKSACYLIVTAKFQNDSTVSGDFLQSAILQHMGEILALFSNPEPQKLEASQETFTPVVIALIAICAFMLIGTIVLIAYIHNTTKRFKRYKQLHHHLTRQSSLYESQELKIEMPEEQTSDYNGSINGSHSLRNSNGDLKEGVVSAFTNPAFISDETGVKLTSAEQEAEQSLNDLANRLDAEESKVMIVDSYNPSESDVEVEPIRDYENTPTRYQDAIPNSYENVPHKFDSNDLPEDYPENDENKAESENNTNKDGDDEEEPNPDYEVKAVRFSAQVLDTEENKFEPLREKDDKAESKKDEESGEELDSGANSDQDNEEPPKVESKNSEDDKDDDFGDGIENERTDEEIFSPNEVLQAENQTDEDNIPHFSFDTKM